MKGGVVGEPWVLRSALPRHTNSDSWQYISIP